MQKSRGCFFTNRVLSWRDCKMKQNGRNRNHDIYLLPQVYYLPESKKNGWMKTGFPTPCGTSKQRILLLKN